MIEALLAFGLGTVFGVWLSRDAVRALTEPDSTRMKDPWRKPTGVYSIPVKAENDLLALPVTFEGEELPICEHCSTPMIPIINDRGVLFRCPRALRKEHPGDV